LELASGEAKMAQTMELEFAKVSLVQEQPV